MPTTLRYKLLVCCCGLLSAATAWAADAEGVKPLFDGKTLAGWEGSQEVFRVEDGAIVGGGPSEAWYKEVSIRELTGKQ
jgi:hypothetical protein